MSERASVDKLAFGVEPAKRRYRLRLARYQALAETLVSHLSRLPEEKLPVRLLDVGVGKGRTRRYLEPWKAERLVRFHGLDINPTRLSQVYRSAEWHLVRTDLTCGIPFGDETFDVVICEQVLEHIPNPLFALQEISRVLRPRGLLVVGVPTLPPGVAAAARFFIWAVGRVAHVKLGHGELFSLRSIRSALGELGTFDVQGARGFRVFSGDWLGPLEDYHWWYRWNRALGEKVPWLCIEVQLVACKRGEMQS